MKTAELATDRLFEDVETPNLLNLIELVLKDRDRLHQYLRDPVMQPQLIPRFLAIALIGFTLFGISLTVVLNAAQIWPEPTPIAKWINNPNASLIEFSSTAPESGFAVIWQRLAGFDLILAYALGLIAATGVVLPSLYFYGLLSGVRLSMLAVTAHALKGQATTGVALVGILPIYVAVSMGAVVFGAPQSILKISLLLGLILPFIAGLWGARSLYIGFAGLCDTMPPERREKRACFLRRLVFSWSACYTAITPVMVFTLWTAFSS